MCILMYTEVVECMPGQRELENAIVAISEIVEELDFVEITNKSAEEKQAELIEARLALQTYGTKMTMAANALFSASTGTSLDLKNGAESIVEAFRNMVKSTANFGSNSDEAVFGKLASFIQDAGISCTILLQASKGFAADNSNINFRDQLLDSAKSISDAMSGILELCSAVAVGHKECNDAYQIISSTVTKLDSATDTAENQDSYGECIAKLSEKTKSAVTAVGAINILARGGDMGRLANKVVEVSLVNNLIKNIGCKQYFGAYGCW